MYSNILLAYDGSVDGRLALHEGARLAQLCGANVFLLAVVSLSTGIMMAEGAVPGAVERQRDTFEVVLREGVQRLETMGLFPTARLAFGDPAQGIETIASETGADLVVVGHHHQNPLARWWNGSVGANLLDRLQCSLLVAQKNVA